MIHRLVSVPLSSSNFREEVSVIKYLAEINDLNLDIDSLIRRKRTAFVLDSATTHERNLPPKKKNGLNYLSWGACLLLYLSCAYKFYFRPAFCTVNNLRSIFTRLEDSVPFLQKSGVYALQCSDCPTVYVGQTMAAG